MRPAFSGPRCIRDRWVAFTSIEGLRTRGGHHGAVPAPDQAADHSTYPMSTIADLEAYMMGYLAERAAGRFGWTGTSSLYMFEAYDPHLFSENEER